MSRSDLPSVSSQRIAGEEEARRRIGRELHDDLGQRLAALAIELEAARRRLPEDGPPNAELAAVGAAVSRLAEDVRRLSHDLHPVGLQRHGLAAALRDHCAEVERRHRLAVRFSRRDSDGPLPPEVALGLYRVAQEALANAVRHAAAGAAEVTLAVADGTVRLAVADDGAGFDPAGARRGGGLGLASIEERARLLGGRSRVRSAPGAGTEIEVTVPLPAAGTGLHHLGRLVRRYRRLAAAGALVILALAGGLLATAMQARRAAQEAARADAVARFLEELFEASDPRRAQGEPPDVRELLARGTERLGSELAEPSLARARLLDTLGGIHTELGLYDQARPLLEEALALRRRLLGDRHPEVAATLVRLGTLAHLSGQGDPEAFFRSALALREDRFGPDHPEVADVLNRLGATLAARGRFDEAESTLRRALAIHERLWGEDDPRLAKQVHNLGGIALYHGRIEDAERLIERALAIREAALPEDDLDLAGTREALALVRRQQGRPAEAAALLERLAATAERVWGPEHPYLAKTLLNLGLARRDLGQDVAAGELYERALAIDEKALAPDHPQLLRALATLAEHRLERGREAEAEPLYRRLVALHDAGAAYEDWDGVLARAERLGLLPAERPSSAP